MATYRRRTILINRPFQLRFCFYVSAWVLALCFIYPLIVANLFDYFARYIAMDPTHSDVGTIYATRKGVVSLLVVTEGVFILLTFLLGLFMSHRIAGPLFKLRRQFAELAKGGFDGKLYFRKKDYFPELADDFNQMVRNIREREIRENEILATAASRIESVMKSASESAKSELETALISIRKLQEQRTPAATAETPTPATESAT
jgi:nitrogen fixation/metabolism regulation signal transduction histidine kinase